MRALMASISTACSEVKNWNFGARRISRLGARARGATMAGNAGEPNGARAAPPRERNCDG